MAQPWQERKARVVQLVKLGRAELIWKLGGRCVWCGSVERLEFDHIHGRDWIPSKLNRWSRLAAYRRDYAAGLLQLLCRSCNASRGRPVACVVGFADDDGFAEENPF